MDQDARQIRWLLAVAVVLCALMIGYNVLFVPQVTLTTVVETDLSSAARAAVPSAPGDASQPEGYEPEPVGQAAPVNLNTADAEELARKDIPEAQRACDGGSGRVKNPAGVGCPTPVLIISRGSRTIRCGICGYIFGRGAFRGG